MGTNQSCHVHQTLVTGKADATMPTAPNQGTGESTVTLVAC